MPETVRELTKATRDLGLEVHDLGDKIRLSEKALKQQRAWIRVQAVCGVLLLCGFLWLWNVAATANHATDAVQTNAVKSCQNANQSRKGTLRLWLGIIDAPRPAGAPSRTPEQQKQTADLREFIEQLFQPRDCQNLDRDYPLPELPDSLKPKGAK